MVAARSSSERGATRIALIVLAIVALSAGAALWLVPGLVDRLAPERADPAEPAAPAAPGGAPPDATSPPPALPGIPAPAPPPELILYRGEVSDPLARPIAGATIAAGAAPSAGERVATADAEGRFEIELPAGERPFVRISAPGHPRLVIELEREPRVPYLLFRGGTIRGTVRGAAADAPPDAPPAPVAGVRIEAAGTQGWWDEAVTDAEGRYAITAPQGPLVLTVRSAAHRDVRILDLEAVRDAEVARDILLEPGIEVEAIVLADGAPLPDAEVRVLTDLGEEAAGRTDGIGRIVLGGLSPGNGRLVVVARGRRAELDAFSIPEGSPRIRRTVALERAAPYVLEVVDTAGSPRPDAMVRVRLDQIVLATAPAGDAPALQVLGRERVYSFDVAAPDTPRVRARFRVPPEGPSLLRVVLPTGRRFRGTAVDARGIPVAGAGVLIISLGSADESWGTPQLTTTGVDGAFRSELLAPGPYRVQVHHEQLGRMSVDTALPANEDRDLGKIALPE